MANLRLKWGNVKGWDGLQEGTPAWSAMEAYIDSGQGMSAMQRQLPEQKELICALIDAIDGEIQNDWTGEMMTKDEAKRYVREYE
jgi:hypothetical protein